MSKTIEEVWSQLSPRSWNEWVKFAADRRGHAQDLGLILDSLTPGRDQIELYRSTICPVWAKKELEKKAEGGSGGAFPESALKKHQEMWRNGDWYNQRMDDLG